MSHQKQKLIEAKSIIENSLNEDGWEIGRVSIEDKSFGGIFTSDEYETQTITITTELKKRHLIESKSDTE